MDGVRQCSKGGLQGDGRGKNRSGRYRLDTWVEGHRREVVGGGDFVMVGWEWEGQVSWVASGC